MTHGLLVVDKPSGPTSHDVVRWARRVFRTRAVGHAGTLDPLASGVLLLGIGEATKLLNHLSGIDKRYAATLELGVATDSLDAQGVALASAPVPALSLEQVREVARGFVGEHLQRAPEISAIKQGGVPLYERVRRGEQVIAPERLVQLHSLDVLSVQGAVIELELHCAKGFYVRSLARDLAQALGTLGHLTRLRRTASGAFSLADAIAGAELSRAAEPSGEPARAACLAALLSPTAALRGQPSLTLSPEGVVDVGHGRAVVAERVREALFPAVGSEPVALLDDAGVLRALGRVEEGRVLVVRGFSLG